MIERKMRFSESAWRLIQAEAEREGISATAYVREAALARVLYARARRGDTIEGGEQYDDLIRRLREE